MKYLKVLFFSFLLVFAINFVTIGSNLVSADDDFDEEYENHDEDEKEHGQYGEYREGGPYEEIGETVGWGTVIAMGITGLIFPIRRSMKWTISNFPEWKKFFISISKFFGKYHIFLGIIALALSIFHGVIMYFSEGKLESEGIVGLGAVVSMTIAGIMGAVLLKNKKVKSLRNAHMFLIALACLFGVVHIFLS